MSCKCAKPTDEWHGWECSITEGACMFLIPNSKACAEKYGEGPDANNETTNIIKLRFIRNDKPQGREYSYYTPVPVETGDIVQLESNDGEYVRGVVTQIDVPESEVAAFKDRMKTIYGRAPMSMQTKFKGES